MIGRGLAGRCGASSSSSSSSSSFPSPRAPLLLPRHGWTPGHGRVREDLLLFGRVVVVVCRLVCPLVCPFDLLVAFQEDGGVRERAAPPSPRPRVYFRAMAGRRAGGVTRATRTTFQRKRFGPPPEERRGVRGRASESVPLHPRRVLAKAPSHPAAPALLPPCVGARFLLRALCREVVPPSARALRTAAAGPGPRRSTKRAPGWITACRGV